MNQNPMKKLKEEAVLITKDLGNVVFIGAVAVYLHSKISRSSRDLDFIFVTNLTKEQMETELSNKGYNIYPGEKKRYSPRNYKVDVYTKGVNINEIDVDTIVNTSKSIDIGKNKVKIASLEVMIVSKFRANRAQDRGDLQDLFTKKNKEIKWNEVEKLVNNTPELDRIKALKNIYK